jgi:hypothetical protein
VRGFTVDSGAIENAFGNISTGGFDFDFSIINYAFVKLSSRSFVISFSIIDIAFTINLERRICIDIFYFALTINLESGDRDRHLLLCPRHQHGRGRGV